MPNMWESRYAQRVQHMKSSTIRELLKVTQMPDFISFAGGLPAPELFPIAEIDAAAHRVLTENGRLALQYGTTEGYYPLREYVAQSLSTPELQLSAENVLITSGSQQALDLLGRIFLDEGDTVLVDSPTYMGALQAWSMFGINYKIVPTDEQGIIVDELEQLLAARPKWIYAMPNFQNPTGLTLNLKRRQQLVEATNRHNVTLLEDDPYVRLRFEGEHLPSLLQLTGSVIEQGKQGYQGNTVYLGTFSKTMAPGLRLGWVVGPTEVVGKLAQAKQGADLHSSTFNQMLAYEIARSGFLPTHIERIRKVYQQRRDVMLEAMQRHFPEDVTYTRPEGGMFLWITMQPQVDTDALLGEALTYKVAFVPGSAFHAQGGGKNTMRLSYVTATPELIEEGIARLGQVFRKDQENKTRASVIV